MNTDHELLELAAKAAGMQGYKFTGTSMAKMIDPNQPDTTGSIGPNWNPLTDDGDALRLVVRLHISVYSNIVRIETGTIQLTLDRVFIHESTLNQDESVATRRAIVRAAAEIGRRMP